MHNVIWMGTWRVVVIDGVNIGSFLQHVGSYVLAYVHTYMHTYMHLGSWIFFLGPICIIPLDLRMFRLSVAILALIQ